MRYGWKMAKGRWKKNDNVNKLILQVLKVGRKPMTTGAVKEKLQGKNVRVGWHTLSRYLEELKTAGHVVCNKVEKENVLHFWEIKE